MLFIDKIHELPKSSDHKDLFQIYDSSKNKATIQYLEDMGEDPRYVKDVYEMYDIYAQKMLSSPLSVEKLKMKQDIVRSIGEHPKYLDEYGVPILMVNNTPLFYKFEDYICFNDKERNYPIMYIDKNFLRLDHMGRFQWIMSPQDMRNYFKSTLDSGKTISSLSFMRAVGPELECNCDVDVFELRSSLCILLPMTRDFLDFYDHPIFYYKDNIMGKFYSMIAMFIDYMFSVYCPDVGHHQYVGTQGLYSVSLDRPNVVLSGYGAIGLKNSCYTAYSFFNASCFHFNTNLEYFESGVINSQVSEEVRLVKLMDEALEEVLNTKDEVPLYGVVKVAENYSLVEECETCVSMSSNVLDPQVLNVSVIPGTTDFFCTYGIVSSIGRTASEARNNVAMYMMDCPYISDVLVSDAYISVNKKGKELKTSRYSVRRDCERGYVYKARRRIVDFSMYKRKFKSDGISTYIDPSSFRNVRVHDVSGKLLHVEEPIMHLVDRNLMENAPIEESSSDLSSDRELSGDLDTSSSDPLVGLFKGVGALEVSGDCISSPTFKGSDPRLSGLTIKHDYIYWYAISVKRFFYSIGIKCGLTHSQLSILVRGSYIKFVDLSSEVLSKLREFSLFKFRSNKLAINVTYSSQVRMIIGLFQEGKIKIVNSPHGGYVWMLTDEDENQGIKTIYSI